MEWQALVLGVQVLLLAAGWHLFQRARGELSARAAETPILGEVKRLQAHVQQLLEDIEQASDNASRHLETRCVQARELANSLDARLAEWEAARTRPLPASPSWDDLRLPQARTSGQTASETRLPASNADTGRPLRLLHDETAKQAHRQTDAASDASADEAICYNQRAVTPQDTLALPLSPREQARRRVYTLADEGRATSEIARATGLSEGEVETMLGLRAAGSG